MLPNFPTHAASPLTDGFPHSAEIHVGQRAHLEIALLDNAS